MNKCIHCGGEGNYLFKSGDWCCTSNAQKCPAVRAKRSRAMLKRYENSTLNLLRISIEEGTAKCFYCGEKADYIVSHNRACCVDRAVNCPKHAEVVGPSMKASFTPERREKMVESGKECQQRPEVKEKKSNSMYLLHNGDDSCGKCVEFQENYKKGRVKFIETLRIKKESIND